MLKLKPERPETVTGDVEITVPGQDETERFKGVFKYRDKEEFLDFTRSLAGKSDLESTMEMLVDWKDVDGPFNKENVELVLSGYNTAGHEIFLAYQKALFESKVKN